MAHVTLLNNNPDYAPILASWAYGEWYRKRSVPFELVVKFYRSRTNSEEMPITWVAIEDGIPAGMVSLKLNDLWSRKDLNPWLSSLFVLEDYRNRGIGSQLIGQVIETAKMLKFPKLYLFTDTGKIHLDGYYLKSGWSFLEKADGNDGVIINIFYYNFD